MARMKKEIYKKQRKPIIVLICEGRNQTETKYFNHFNKRENPYNLKILPSEATDPKNMAKKARETIENLQLDKSLGDRIFCLVDLDLSTKQLKKVEEEKNKKTRGKCKVEFILSNPCFEAWLLFYFVQHPKVEQSSQKVKEQLKKHVPQYSESFDIVKECKLEEKYPEAISRANLKNNTYSSDNILDKNPYTEIPVLLNLLLNFSNNKR